MPARINTDHIIGRTIKESNLTISMVCRHTGIHPRTMTEYVAGRKDLLPHHRFALSTFFKVRPEFWDQGEPVPVEQPPGRSTG